MGGTRFSNVAHAVRVGRAEHDAIASRTVEALRRLGVDARAIPTLGVKADFGDVDLIATRSSIDAVGDGQVAEASGAIAHHRGDAKDPTFSMLVPGIDGPVQVDVICVAGGMIDFAAAQLSYGEASPLSGIVARQMGLKLGMHGLLLTDEDGHGLMRARIDVTHAEALDLIGLDPTTHAAGFHDLDDVFAWIAAGRYFDPGVFAYERMTNRARARAQKRPAYARFLQWLDQTHPPARYDWGPRGHLTDEWRSQIAEMHPEAALDIHRTKGSRKTKSRFRAFFNGETVERATGVSDPRLRHLMNALRKDVGMERLHAMAEAEDHDGLAREARRLAATDYLPEGFDEEDGLVCG